MNSVDVRKGSDSTGSHDFVESTRYIDYPFGEFTIKVAVDEDYHFVGIGEILVAKNFLSIEQKLATQKVHDVEKYYND